MKRAPLWKLVGAGQREIEFYNFPPIMYQLKHRLNETVDIYYMREGSWDLVFTQRPKHVCACGKEYKLFKFRDSFFDKPQTLEEQIAWLKLPLLCISCYYRKEHGRGHWIPKQVAQELGLKK